MTQFNRLKQGTPKSARESGARKEQRDRPTLLVASVPRRQDKTETRSQTAYKASDGGIRQMHSKCVANTSDLPQDPA